MQAELTLQREMQAIDLRTLDAQAADAARARRIERECGDCAHVKTLVFGGDKIVTCGRKHYGRRCNDYVPVEVAK